MSLKNYETNVEDGKQKSEVRSQKSRGQNPVTWDKIQNPNRANGDSPFSSFINTRLQPGVIVSQNSETVSTVSRSWCAILPLTPALSPSEGERENRRQGVGEILLRLFALGLALLCLAAANVHACGPFFPNNLLDRGDEAVLSAPVADFERELQQLKLAPSRFEAVITTNSYEQDTFGAETMDLTAALKKGKVPPSESERIIETHQANRKKLSRYIEAHGEWEGKAWMDAHEDSGNKRGPEPAFPAFEEVPGLPGEFADYFAGVVALRKPGTINDDFHEAWKRLLARPATERKYKSVWAAFMLGKTHEQSDDDKAIEYFQMTRDLAKQRFADSIGLAVAAIGLEARVELRRKHFQRAIKLYLEQYAAGDGSAVVSLRWSAGEALAAGGEELAALAAEANTRSVVTAYLICGERGERFASSGSPATNCIVAWLRAVEAAGVKDMESAERLALAAYQEGEFESAQRWVNRARRTPVAQWLQAKLYLRAGKTQEAAALLAKVSALLPVVTDAPPTNSAEFADNLQMALDSNDSEPARRQILGELGVLHLSRHEFTQALDALLRAGFWMDAAYVAERVLTMEELKNYVDQQWPTTAQPEEIKEYSDRSAGGNCPATQRQNIRYVLARRLTRLNRGDEAREYFPAKLQPQLNALVQSLNTGWDENQPADIRATAFFRAAIIARTNGMELLGTETAPDWAIHDGQFEDGVSADTRTNENIKILPASADELNRAAQHGVEPEERFHYRYQAASLAWEAAKLLPDNSDQTARVLCTAGSWLKLRDPEAADYFYKALVRRCRKTAIGEQADRMRWFPVLDETGNPKSWNKPPPAIPLSSEAETPHNDGQRETSSPGDNPLATGSESNFEYIIHVGDSLAAIVQACRDLKVMLTVEDILNANPGLNAAKLKVGQKILIPKKGTATEIPY